MSFSLSMGMVLLLPLDVANARTNGGLDMKSFWYTLLMTTCIWIFLILPTAMFFYESEGDKIRHRFLHAFKMEFFLIIIVSIVLFLTYAFLNKANIPVEERNCTTFVTLSNTGFSSCSSKSNTLTMNVSFAVYLICLVAFCGWFLFVLFTGVGLSALPMDLINEFRTRP